MRIGVNCLRIYPGYKGGVNSFTFGLLDGFAASRRGHEFVIFVTRSNRELFSHYREAHGFRLVEIDDRYSYKDVFAKSAAAPAGSVRPGLLRWIARQCFERMPWKLRYKIPLAPFNDWLERPYLTVMERAADVHYVPYPPSPLFPFPDMPTLYSIHDLQHVHFPEFFSAEQKRERDVVLDNCVRHASLVQATSQQMREEFLAHFSFLTPDKIVIVPEGVDVDAYARAGGDVRSKYGLPERFLYYPAQLWHHKNHIVILKALLRLKQQGINISLVLTGARYSASQHLFDFIAENGLGEQVFYLGLVPYEDVIALHRAARFMITASFYEAGSIPVLEAAAANTPIIASITPSHVEHSHDLQMQLFPPADDAALAALLLSVWDDDALIARQVAFNNLAVRQFTWNNAAERYLIAFEKLSPARNTP